MHFLQGKNALDLPMMRHDRSIDGGSNQNLIRHVCMLRREKGLLSRAWLKTRTPDHTDH
jgi:hypothetical protein